MACGVFHKASKGLWTKVKGVFGRIGQGALKVGKALGKGAVKVAAKAGAPIGAAIGSVIPGVGTGIGTAIGGAVQGVANILDKKWNNNG